MKRFLLLSVILIAVAIVMASDDVAELQANAILELREATFDFGVAPIDQRWSHHFLIRSVGEDPLLISQVRATCGCTSAPLEKDSLVPGDSTFLKVSFNSRGRYGRRNRNSVRITSNCKGSPTQSVTFTSHVDSTMYTVMRPEPFAVDIGGGDDFLEETTFFVKNVTDNETFEFSVVSYDFDNIESINIRDNKLKPGEQTEVKVKMIKPEVPTLIYSSVTFEATDKATSRITVPISGGGRSARRPPPPAAQELPKTLPVGE